MSLISWCLPLLDLRWFVQTAFIQRYEDNTQANPKEILDNLEQDVDYNDLIEHGTCILMYSRIIL